MDHRPEKIISGGQTGVDRAALDVALQLGIACGGWCPKGRLAEDGPIPSRYPLDETPKSEYAQRTRWNVRDSDATLVLAVGEPGGGTALTIAQARRLGRPLLIVDLDWPRPEALAAVSARLAANSVRVLNVAGPRESQQPGISARAAEFLRALLDRREL